MSRKYVKKFEHHTEYETYINSGNAVLPNVSFCEVEDEIHCNPVNETNVVVTLTVSGINHSLYFDDFPQEICDAEYDGDMQAFKEDFVSDPGMTGNRFNYIGLFQFNGQTYYIWEFDDEVSQPVYSIMKYILTERSSFTGLSLDDNINNNYCPFVYVLNEDMDVTYTNQTTNGDYILVAEVGLTTVNKTFLYDTSNISKVEIDGVVQPSVVTSYNFDFNGEHTIKLTLQDNLFIEEDTFYECNSIETVTLPDSVQTIYERAFYGCENLEKIKINGTLTSIASQALYKTKIDNITLPDIVNIQNYAFDGASVTNVTLGEDIQEIEANAFVDSNLETLTIYADEPPTLGSSFGVENLSAIYVPKDSVSAYKTATNWSQYANIILPIF